MSYPLKQTETLEEMLIWIGKNGWTRWGDLYAKDHQKVGDPKRKADMYEYSNDAYPHFVFEERTHSFERAYMAKKYGIEKQYKATKALCRVVHGQGIDYKRIMQHLKLMKEARNKGLPYETY